MARKKKNKSRRKRKKPILFYLLIIILLLAVGGYFLSKVVLTINVIEVSGTEKYESSKIIISSEIKYGINYLEINKKKAIDKIEKEFPYLEDTDIRYRPFQKVHISTSEAKPTYYIEYQGKYALLSERFKVLEYPIAIEPEEGIIFIEGITLDVPVEGESAIFVEEDADIKKQSLKLIVDEMKENGLSKITKIDASDNYSIEMIYDNRILIFFGSHARIERKVLNLKMIIDENYSEGQSARIDLSTLEGPEPKVGDLPLQSIEDYYKIYKKDTSSSANIQSSDVENSDDEENSDTSISDEEQSKDNEEIDETKKPQNSEESRA